MANYYGTGRSNYFAVKNREAFEEFCKKCELELIESDGLVGFVSLSEDGDFHLDPRGDELDSEEVPAAFHEALAGHLANGHVAILMHAGSEKARYIGGTALAVDSTGHTEIVRLADIYDVVERKFGVIPSVCEY